MRMDSTGRDEQGTLESDDAALVRAAQETPTAFAALYERHYPAVYAFVARRTSDDMQAEDVTAQTFAHALAALKQYQDRGIPFAAWLLRIAAHEVTDQGRRQTRRRRLAVAPGAAATTGHDGAAVDPLDWTAEWERAAWLRAHLTALSSDQRRVVWLRFWEDRTVDDVAARMDRSPGATKQLLYRALRILRMRLQADGAASA